MSGTSTFGDALINAIRLEKLAVYPRIAIDKQVNDLINPKQFGMVESELTYDKKLGYYYLDIFKHDLSILQMVAKEEREGYKEITLNVNDGFVKDVIPVVNGGLEHPEYRVREKYIWMHEKLMKYQPLAEVARSYKIQPVSLKDHLRYSVTKWWITVKLYARGVLRR